jgi:hypothetical protein
MLCSEACSEGALPRQSCGRCLPRHRQPLPLQLDWERGHLFRMTLIGREAQNGSDLYSRVSDRDWTPKAMTCRGCSVPRVGCCCPCAIVDAAATTADAVASGNDHCRKGSQPVAQTALSFWSGGPLPEEADQHTYLQEV